MQPSPMTLSVTSASDIFDGGRNRACVQIGADLSQKLQTQKKSSQKSVSFTAQKLICISNQLSLLHKVQTWICLVHDELCNAITSGPDATIEASLCLIILQYQKNIKICDNSNLKSGTGFFVMPKLALQKASIVPMSSQQPSYKQA